MVIQSQSHSEYKLPLKETQETSILATWQPHPLTNQSSSPCYLFLATCFVISVSRYSCWTIQTQRGEIIKSNTESSYPTLQSSLKTQTLSETQLREEDSVDTAEYNPAVWSDPRTPNLLYSRFYAHEVNALSSERRLAGEASCWGSLHLDAYC